VLFNMAITPSGEMLSFVARRSSDWNLYRIRNWSAAQPAWSETVLQGFFSEKDRRDMQSLFAQVFVSSDGRYAVCVGSATWWQEKERRAVAGTERGDDVIATFDLAANRLIAFIRTRELGLFSFHDVKIDDAGYVLVDSVSTGKPKRGAFVRLAVPSLTGSQRCAYDWVSDSRTKQHRTPTTETACAGALGSHYTFEQYFQTEKPSFTWPPTICKDNPAQFCRLPGQFSQDGKYGLAELREGHDNLFGNWVESRNSYVIFSSAVGADIGEIHLPTDDSVMARFAYLDAHDYVLLLRDGTQLTVYELR
jgi:hypothetical protein